MKLTALRPLLFAAALLPVIGSPGAQAAPMDGVHLVRFICNADGRCFETGDLDRRDDYDAPRRDYRRPPPPDFERDEQDFYRRPPPHDLDRPPPRDFDRRGPRDDDDPD